MGLKDSSKLGSKDSKLRPKDTKLKLASLRLDTSLLLPGWNWVATCVN